MKPYLATDLKVLNRQSVYRLMEKKEVISRSEIARITNISMPTVMKIAAYFLEKGIVSEAGDGVTAIGRKPQMLRFEQSAYYSVGIEYEGDYLRAGMVDLRGRIQRVFQERVVGRFQEVVNDQLFSLVEKVISQSGVPHSRIAGVGMGVPAIVDVDRVTVSAAPTVGILEDVDCKPILAGLSQRLGLPLYLENDTNAAALGEYAISGQAAATDLLYVSLGTGLGAGLIIQGKLCRGHQNFGGEIGFMVFDRNFETDPARRGWLEDKIGLQTLCARYPFLKQIVEEGDDVQRHQKELCALADEVGGYLALAITNINSLLDLDTVVLGGYTTRLLGNLLTDAVNRYLGRLSSCHLVCKQQLCPEPSIVGAALLAMEQKLQDLFSEG